MNKVSAVIISRNEGLRIEDTLKSVQWADEIVLVDSGSSDNTVKIAARYTDKIFFRDFDDFSSQKNFALSKCSCPWIFSIDCDEVVTGQLQSSILQAVNLKNQYCAYKIKRSNKIFGKILSHAAGNDYPVRLFKKENAVFVQPIHEFLRIDGQIGSLKGELLHNSTPDIGAEYKKTDEYTELEAKWLLERNIRPSVFRLFIYPPFVFFKIYLLNLGFLDGFSGFLFAFVSARYAFIKYLKAYKLSKDPIYLEKKISLRFNELHKQFPDSIDLSDSRLSRLLEALKPMEDELILEVGCGKGRFTNEISKKKAKCIGIDVSDNFLNEAVKKNKGFFLKSSATMLAFKDKSFDAAFSVEVIEHLPDLEKFILEVARVLRNDGRLVIIDRNILSVNNRRYFFPNILIKKYHELKNDWMYPRGFPYTEKWFFAWRIAKLLKKYFQNVEYSYVISDLEKKSKTGILFRLIPLSRHFILWKAEGLRR